MKKVKSKKLMTNLFIIFVLGIFVIYGIITLIYFKINISNFSKLLGIDATFDSTFLFLMTYSYILIIGFILWIRNDNQKHTRLIAFFNKCDIYFITAIYFSLIVTFYGYFFLSLNFGQSLPIENVNLLSHNSESVAQIISSSLNGIPKMSCSSQGDKNEFVINDKLNCDIYISFKDEASYETPILFVSGRLLNGTNNPIHKRTYTPKSNQMAFSIKIDDYNYYEFFISLGFSNRTDGKNDIGTYQQSIDVDILSPQGYRDKNNRKLGFIFTLLSIGTLAIFSTMRSIKGLMNK